MSICLCYDSADKALDLIALGCLSQLGRASRPALDQCTARERDLKALQSLPIGFEEPVHVLVPRQELRICNERVCAHVWSGRLLNDSLVLLAPGSLHGIAAGKRPSQNEGSDTCGAGAHGDGILWNLRHRRELSRRIRQA